jgi:hypothetical protein
MFTDDSKRTQVAKKLLTLITRQARVFRDPKTFLRFFLFGGVVRDHLDSEHNGAEFKFNDLDMFITVNTIDRSLSMDARDLVVKTAHSLKIFGICSSIEELTKESKYEGGVFCYRLHCEVDGEKIDVDIVGIQSVNDLEVDFTCNSWYVNFDYDYHKKQLKFSEPETATRSSLAAIAIAKKQLVLFDKTISPGNFHSYPRFVKLIKRTIKMIKKEWTPSASFQNYLDSIGFCKMEDTDFHECFFTQKPRAEVQDEFVIKLSCDCELPFYSTIDGWCAYLIKCCDESREADCKLCKEKFKL